MKENDYSKYVRFDHAAAQPDFTEQSVTPEQMVLGTARLDSHFRKWLVEQLTSMGDSRLRWEPSPRYVADFTEQARQLCEKMRLSYARNQQLVDAIASLTAEAATQGQATGIARAIAIAEARIQDVPEHLDIEADRNAWLVGYFVASSSIKVALQRLLPDLNYLDRVRNEAATAALEQAARVIRERRKWYDEELFGAMPSMEDATDNEKRLVTLASANMARHTCDHLLKEIATLNEKDNG